MSKTQKVEIAFDFDTTGSMYPCIDIVRKKVEAILTPLFKELPDLRVAIGANGDYCDERSTYANTWLPLTHNLHDLCKFVREVKRTSGGDAPECYELVLRNARNLSWSPDATKILVLIADDEPHDPNYYDNKLRIDWREEARKLKQMGVSVYAVQCLSKSRASYFYRDLAALTGGYHLELDQFGEILDLILAICYKQFGTERLQVFEEQVAKRGMSRTLDSAFTILANRKNSIRFKPVEAGLKPVAPGRFQILEIDERNPIQIRDFVNDRGLLFQTGKGFYEFTKPELIQERKEVVLRDKRTGDMFTGDRAREMIGLPAGIRGKVKPADLARFDVFVQSTSYNRKLVPGTRFLYEVDLDR